MLAGEELIQELVSDLIARIVNLQRGKM